MSLPAKSRDKADGYEMVRAAMVDRLRQHYLISDERVLGVMSELPRHLFVPDALRPQAYKDSALPISGGQTISQPYIVAKMTELLGLDDSEKVLEVGAGTGYQTAILASLARKVFAIERLPNLVDEASQRLKALKFRNVSFKTADGTTGWDAYHPFDAILVAAGGPTVPAPLVGQLKVGGRLVIPIGGEKMKQQLIRVTKTDGGYKTEDFGPCSFVPLIGEHGWHQAN
jgi:protein-L-isoaspartate(D-aspartate) O-methyltransferase